MRIYYIYAHGEYALLYLGRMVRIVAQENYLVVLYLEIETTVYSAETSGVVKVGGWFELLFVNSFGMPFNSGLIVYIILLAASIIWGVYA